MKVIGVIPARYGSTRFEGKVIADIMGKSMLERVWERAKQSFILDDLIIACDDQRIAQVAAEFCDKVVMTAKGHSCGTDRIIEVVNPLDVGVIVNIQADEPLIHPQMIDTVAQEMLDNPGLSMATLKREIDNPADINDHNVIKVVTDKQGFALYFSRSAVPCYAGSGGTPPQVYYKHIGLYGYTKDFLFVYRNLPASFLEKAERLEQLRVLENGYRIKVLETKHDTIGVDTPEDLERVRRCYRE